MAIAYRIQNTLGNGYAQSSMPWSVRFRELRASVLIRAASMPGLSDGRHELAVFLDAEFYLHDMDCMPLIRE
jgi:hypothetical protein